MKLNKKYKAMLASYARSFGAAVIAVNATGNNDVKSVIIAALSATLPVAIRAINPKDPAFGIAAKVATDALAKLSEASKAPAKKTAKKDK
jgi:hypothetical protein